LQAPCPEMGERICNSELGINEHGSFPFGYGRGRNALAPWPSYKGPADGCKVKSTCDSA
jgi:hypothetical protein